MESNWTDSNQKVDLILTELLSAPSRSYSRINPTRIQGAEIEKEELQRFPSF